MFFFPLPRLYNYWRVFFGKRRWLLLFPCFCLCVWMVLEYVQANWTAYLDSRSCCDCGGWNHLKAQTDGDRTCCRSLSEKDKPTNNARSNASNTAKANMKPPVLLTSSTSISKANSINQCLLILLSQGPSRGCWRTPNSRHFADFSQWSRRRLP